MTFPEESNDTSTSVEESRMEHLLYLEKVLSGERARKNNRLLEEVEVSAYA